MKFNIDKSHTMRITLHRNTINTDYHLGGSTLSVVSQYPYLGVTISNTMSWQINTNGITAHASKMLGLIRLNLRGTSQKLRQQAYISLVRPHLEYCCTVWNPYTRKEVTKIENIQRRAARFVSNNYGQRESVHYDSIKEDKSLACLLLIYRINTQQIATNCNRYLAPMLPNSTKYYHPNKNIKSSQIASRCTTTSSHAQHLVERPPHERVGSTNPRGLQRSCYHTVTTLSRELCF